MYKMSTCPGCGKKIGGRVEICPDCGTKMIEKVNWTYWVIGGLAVVVIILLIAVF